METDPLPGPSGITNSQVNDSFWTSVVDPNPK
jgi:hypothetical protein